FCSLSTPCQKNFHFALTDPGGEPIRNQGLTQKGRRCSRWLLIVSICEPAYLHGFVTARRFRAAGDRDART
ncbi:hypothetical protein, partial [Pseudoxanthomonas mexicana]